MRLSLNFADSVLKKIINGLSLDLDECLLGVHNCDIDERAICLNQDGSYECTCKGNYFGNGISCFSM